MAAPIVIPPPAVVDRFRTAERQLAVTAALAIENPDLSDAERMDRIRVAYRPVPAGARRVRRLVPRPERRLMGRQKARPRRRTGLTKAQRHQFAVLRWQAAVGWTATLLAAGHHAVTAADYRLAGSGVAAVALLVLIYLATRR